MPLKVKAWVWPLLHRRGGLCATDLMTIDADGELRVATVVVLVDGDDERVAAGTDGDRLRPGRCGSAVPAVAGVTKVAVLSVSRAAGVIAAVLPS